MRSEAIVQEKSQTMPIRQGTGMFTTSDAEQIRWCDLSLDPSSSWDDEEADDILAGCYELPRPAAKQISKPSGHDSSHRRWSAICFQSQGSCAVGQEDPLGPGD